MITHAAVELMIYLSESVESKPHTFSKRFERKMKHLLRTVDHSVGQRVASFTLVILLGIMSIIAASPTARAAVLEWIRQQYETYIEYFLPQGLRSDERPCQYTISQLPDGYFETTRFDVEGSCTVLYAHDTKKRIHFIYSKDPEAVAFTVMSDESTVIKVDVEGCTADLYIPQNPNEATSIVWYDNKQETIFYISAVLEANEIIKLAESVTQVS